MKDLKGMQLPTLTDGRLVVRPWRPDDAPAVYEACQDPEIARWTKVIPTPYEYRHATEFIAAAWRDWIDEATAGFAVVDAGDGGAGSGRPGDGHDGFLGAVGLVIDCESEVGEFGYWVAPWARRRGVASGAVKLVAAWALDVLKLGRLEIQFLDGNEASRRVTETCGFTFEGVLRAGLIQRGARVDTGISSLLATDPRPW